MRKSISSHETPHGGWSTAALVVAGVIVVVLRFLVNGGIAFLKDASPQWVILALSVLDGMITVSATVIGAGYIIQQSHSKPTPTVQQFTRWLRVSAIACIAAIVLPQIPPNGWQSLVSISLGSVIVVILVAWIAYMLLRTFYSYRTVRTPLLLRGVGLILGIIFLLRWVEPWATTGKFDAPYVFSGVVISVLVLLLARRRRWLASRTRQERWSIGIWSSAVILLAIVAATNAYDRGSQLAFLLDRWLVGSSLVAGHLFLMLAVYSVVVLWTILTSDSSAERKRFEFDAITFFNSVAAEHSEPQKLYNTITTIAIALTDATSAGLILRRESGEWEAVSWVGIESERARTLELEQRLANTTLQEAVIIPYLRDDEWYFRIARSVESFAQSLMLVPLWEGSLCTGIIVVISNKPYAFEQGDAESLASFAPAVSIVLANQRLLQTAIERERLHRELMLGRQIQQRLLPTAIPLLNNWEVVGWYEPAYEVGGDYFDYFYLGNGTACVIVADVSGKGISAAFYMAKLKGICIALAPFCTTVHEFVVGIQRALDGVLEPRIYISLVAVGINPSGGISIIRAGHPPPLCRTRDGQVRIFSPVGIALGLVPTHRFVELIEECRVEDCSVEHLILYTDGLIEAGVTADFEIGITGLREIVAHHPSSDSAEAMIHAIRQAITERIGATSFTDDITIVAMRRLTACG